MRAKALDFVPATTLREIPSACANAISQAVPAHDLTLRDRINTHAIGHTALSPLVAPVNAYQPIFEGLRVVVGGMPRLGTGFSLFEGLQQFVALCFRQHGNLFHGGDGNHGRATFVSGRGLSVHAHSIVIQRLSIK